MTDREWREHDHPGLMLASLGSRAGGRKLRLFSCACCRRIWGLLGEKGRLAVGAAERYADGLCPAAEATHVCSTAFRHDAWPAEAKGTRQERARWEAAEAVFTLSPRYDTREVNVYASRAEKIRAGNEGVLAYDSALAGILRDLFGGPPRPAAPAPSWLTPTVSGLARTAYDERALPSGELEHDRLAVLSDALEETGCDDADILDHLRSPGPHVRGCWVVDLLLGKE